MTLANAENPHPVIFTSLHLADPPPDRLSTGFREVDRVLGGGFVPGSTVLVSGDPGAGKSTMLLQIAGIAATRGVGVAYISGEEAVATIQQRAARLGVAAAPVALAETHDIDAALAALDREDRAEFVVVDSLQAMTVAGARGAPGTPTQSRAVLARLVEFARRRDAVVAIVNHSTKASITAGPIALQHAVDVVLTVERRGSVRVLQPSKNRFGDTGAVGLLVMDVGGLRE